MHLPKSLGTHVIRPLGEHPLDFRVRDRHELVCLGRQTHEPGPTVCRIRDPLDIAVRLQLLDEERCTLLGDAGLLGQLRDPRAVGTDPSHDPGLGRGDVGDAGGDDSIMCSLLQRSVRDEQQDAEIRLLTIGRHSAKLDR